MNEDNNERLAFYYQSDIPQLVIIFPYCWKHLVDGDWFKSNTLSNNARCLVNPYGE